MRDMAGGDYPHSLKITFIPELLSMNVLMSAMISAMMLLRARIAPGVGPGNPAFWFVIEALLFVGQFIELRARERTGDAIRGMSVMRSKRKDADSMIEGQCGSHAPSRSPRRTVRAGSTGCSSPPKGPSARARSRLLLQHLSL